MCCQGQMMHICKLHHFNSSNQFSMHNGEHFIISVKKMFYISDLMITCHVIRISFTNTNKKFALAFWCLINTVGRKYWKGTIAVYGYM